MTNTSNIMCNYGYTLLLNIYKGKKHLTGSSFIFSLWSVPAVKRFQMGIGFFLRFEGVMTKSRELKFKHGKRSDMWWSRFMSRHNTI